MIEKDELILFENRWKEIDQTGFIKILELAKSKTKPLQYNLSQKEYMTLYTKVYDILITKNQDIRKLCHQRLISTLKFHCKEIYEQLQQNCSVIEFAKKWKAYDSIVITWVLKTFSYMKRIKQLQRHTTLEEEIKSIFKQEVYDRIEVVLKDSLLKNINDYRLTSEKNDFEHLKIFIQFISEFNVNKDETLYKAEYESMILSNVETYYKKLIDDHSKNSYVDYLEFGQMHVTLEEQNAAKYLPLDTIELISERLYQLFFFDKTSSIIELNDGFISLLKKQDYDSLSKTFTIFSKTEKTMISLVSLFKQFIKEQFNALLEKYNHYEGGPQEMGLKTNFIQEYASFQCLMTNLIATCFENNNIFNVSFKEILEIIQSTNDNFNTSYILPFYLNKFLRKSYNNTSEVNTINGIIDQAIIIFPFVYEKDVFMSIYRNLLSDRLLIDDFVSIESEKYLIGKLKNQCGESYTTNIETMISDYYLNKDTTQKYKEWLGEKDPLSNIDQSFVILTNDHWPTLNVSKLVIPEELKQITDRFFTFYCKNYSGRTLQWALYNSTIEINIHFPSLMTSYTINMNTVQGIILLALNKSNCFKMTKVSLMESIGFEKNTDLDNCLLPMIKCQLLIQSDNETSYELNRKYRKSDTKIQIQLASKGEGIIKKERIEDDRTMAIDGTIVRLMKAHKKLNHDELVKLVLESLDKFKIQKVTIKKRIDGLIEKEMMTRDKEDPMIYVYLTNEERKA